MGSGDGVVSSGVDGSEGCIRRAAAPRFEGTVLLLETPTPDVMVNGLGIEGESGLAAADPLDCLEDTDTLRRMPLSLLAADPDRPNVLTLPLEVLP